jgi:hypothetical protein
MDTTAPKKLKTKKQRMEAVHCPLGGISLLSEVKMKLGKTKAMTERQERNRSQ